MKYLIGIIIGYIVAIMSLYGGYLYAQAKQITLTASVEETEINHCAKVLRDAGFLD